MQPERRILQVRYLVRIHDDGAYGARVEYIDRPDGNDLYDNLAKPRQNCPGLGGWKLWNGRWVTWVKGPFAQELIDAASGSIEHMVELYMEADNVEHYEVVR